MLPDLPIHDQGDVTRTEAIGSFQLPLRPQTRRPGSANVSYDGLSQKSPGLALAPRGATVTAPVRHVLVMGTPAQVQEVVVALVAVQMPALHAGWTGPDECLQDQ